MKTPTEWAGKLYDWCGAEASTDTATNIVHAIQQEAFDAGARAMQKLWGGDGCDHFKIERVPGRPRAPAGNPSGFGAPGVRDPDYPCAEFTPGKPDENNRCEGDGHYLCQECGHWRKRAEGEE